MFLCAAQAFLTLFLKCHLLKRFFPQVYNGMLAKSVQCLRTWKQDLVGRANYEELARRLDQVGLKHIMEAYCTFGSFSNTNFQQR